MFRLHAFAVSYSGGLHNNSEYHGFDFGDKIEDGDRVGFILDAGEQELKIYIVQNDRPLGLAYTQKAPYASELYPVATFYQSPAVVEINEKKNVNIDHLLVRTDYLEKGESPTNLAVPKVSLIEIFGYLLADVPTESCEFIKFIKFRHPG